MNASRKRSMKYFGLSQPIVNDGVTCGWCGRRCDSMHAFRIHHGKAHKGKRIKRRNPSSSSAPQPPNAPQIHLPPALPRRRIQGAVGVST